MGQAGTCSRKGNLFNLSPRKSKKNVILITITINLQLKTFVKKAVFWKVLKVAQGTEESSVKTSKKRPAMGLKISMFLLRNA